MKEAVKRISLLSIMEESQVDGKTISHVAKMDYSHAVMGFTDGTYILLETGRPELLNTIDESDLRRAAADLSEEQLTPILNRWVRCNLLTPYQAEQLREKALQSKQENLRRSITDYEQQISRMKEQLSRLNKCSICGK